MRLLARVLHSSGIVQNCYAEPAWGSRWINTKATIFAGSACGFRVRSGDNGLKNIYLDIHDATGNYASIAFLSDGTKGLAYFVNKEEIWRVKL